MCEAAAVASLVPAVGWVCLGVGLGVFGMAFLIATVSGGVR